MSTNNKWGALSMRDRAFLIREAVRNGITDINSIRDTWEHRFDGESSQPTEDEYIAQRAKEKRVEALNRARVAKDIPEIFVEKGWKLQERDDELYNQAVSNLNSLKQEYQNLMIKKLSPNVKGPLSTQDQIDIDYLESTIPKVEEYLEYCKTRRDNPKTSGATCINTVTGYYDRNETWNERFAKQTHGELGFRKISDKEIEPGDIVQFGEAIQNHNTGEWEIQNPGHALMANTKYNADSSNMRWNGSNGDSGEGAVRINSIYPSDWETMQAYRFVGNKADSLQWKKEYREKYGHQFSGEDPNIFTDAWNAINNWVSQEDPESKITTYGPVDLTEIKRRQAWAESKFNSKARSKAGAKGTFQIMDAVKADYIKAGGENGDLYDPVYNEKVRDWLFTNLGTRQWVTKGNPSDSVKVGKQLAAYNAGPGPLLKGLNKAKSQGIDIYKSFDWVNTDYIPEETVDYVNWILRNKPTGVHRNDSVYNLNKHKYKKNKK